MVNVLAREGTFKLQNLEDQMSWDTQYGCAIVHAFITFAHWPRSCNLRRLKSYMVVKVKKPPFIELNRVAKHKCS